MKITIKGIEVNDRACLTEDSPTYWVKAFGEIEGSPHILDFDELAVEPSLWDLFLAMGELGTRFRK